MKFQESNLAHRLLDNKVGIEIGGSAHNPFGIKGCANVDYTDDMTTSFKKDEVAMCGKAMSVDIVAPAWDLPFKNESLDYVLNSHVIEHCWDALGTIHEWFRVLKPLGIIFMIIPHKERTFDKDRPRTTYEELKLRQNKTLPVPEFDTHEHYSVWITADWLEICREEGWNLVCLEDIDDKVGNGMTIVIQKSFLWYNPNTIFR